MSNLQFILLIVALTILLGSILLGFLIWGAANIHWQGYAVRGIRWEAIALIGGGTVAFATQSLRALDRGVPAITQEMKMRAAKALASLVAKPTATKIVPDIFDKRVVPAVAKAIR